MRRMYEMTQGQNSRDQHGMMQQEYQVPDDVHGGMGEA